MQTTINNDAIASGFNMLAQALVPNAQALIQADLARGQRGVYDAQANNYNANAGLASQQSADLRGYSTAANELAQLLATSPDLTDPVARAQIAAILPRLQGGMDGNIAGLTGTTTFINPNFVPDDDLSKIFLGSGIVQNYASTPDGFAVAQDYADMQHQRGVNADVTRTQITADANRDVAALNAQNNLDVLAYRTANGLPATGSGSTPTPPVLNPRDTELLWDAFTAALPGYFGGTIHQIDPAFEQAARPMLAEAYQRTRSADAAIQEVLSQLPGTVSSQDLSWWPTGNSNVLGLAPNAAPSAAPAAPGQPAQTVQPGAQARTPDGKVLTWNGQAWVDDTGAVVAGGGQ